MAVAAGTADGARLGRCGVGIEDSVIADADHDRRGEIAEFVGQRDRVVAGVEDEYGDRCGGVVAAGLGMDPRMV